MDFLTTRGPARALYQSPSAPALSQSQQDQLRIKYTVTADTNEHFPTDGSPRTFYSVCRVAAPDKQAFLESILPDVREGSSDYNQILELEPFQTANPPPGRYYRVPLKRFNPEPHPLRRNAYAVDAVVLGGDGHPASYPTTGNPDDLAKKALTFRRLTGRPGLGYEAGFVRIGVTWKDLPYPANISDDDANAIDGYDGNPPQLILAGGSEAMRFCTFKSTPKGRHVGIQGGILVFINDDGTVIRSKPADPSSPPMLVQEASPIYVPSTAISATMKMMPRVPLACSTMRATVNMWSDSRFPVTIFPFNPPAGTILYQNFEHSDPYYTVSDQMVYDVTVNFLYIPGGYGPFRGHNSTFCSRPDIRDFRRFIFAQVSGSSIVSPPILPVTKEAGSETADNRRQTVKGYNAYNFAAHANLFRLEGRTAS